jgi:phytoene synthase
MNAVASKAARAIIAHHSKSFALASKLLPPRVRNDAVVLYAYCRRVDDAVDNAPLAEQRGALDALRVELHGLYEGAPQSDPLLGALQTVIDDCAIPRFCFDDLLDGMAMDVSAERYQTQTQLLLYCYRVAGTVGLMMCHVMGAKNADALAHGKDLGIAMQLTNIARDVLEDWSRERLYLPEDLMTESGAPGLQLSLGRPFPRSAAPATARAIGTLLTWADGYYASGDRGLRYLSFRCAAAVYAARLVYASIGSVLRRRNCDPFSGRAVVPKSRKLALAVRALIAMAFATALSACAHTQPQAAAQAKPEAAQSMPAQPATQPAAPAAAAPAESPPSQTPAEPAPAVAPAAGEVVVDVIGLDSSHGLLLVALFLEAKGFPDKGAKAFGKRIAKARAGNARIVFRDVPPGPFAVTVHHDEDKDMAMDTGLFGKPTEGYGFSRDASAPFGPPGFADAKLTLAPNERKRVPIHMSY